MCSDVLDNQLDQRHADVRLRSQRGGPNNGEQSKAGSSAEGGRDALEHHRPVCITRSACARKSVPSEGVGSRAGVSQSERTLQVVVSLSRQVLVLLTSSRMSGTVTFEAVVGATSVVACACAGWKAGDEKKAVMAQTTSRQRRAECMATKEGRREEKRGGKWSSRLLLCSVAGR
jgi:hypothetical protein